MMAKLINLTSQIEIYYNLLKYITCLIIRFVEAYKEHGINIWGVTAQNEPNAGLVNFPFQCMGFTAEQQRDYVKIDLVCALFFWINLVQT